MEGIDRGSGKESLSAFVPIDVEDLKVGLVDYYRGLGRKESTALAGATQACRRLVTLLEKHFPEGYLREETFERKGKQVTRQYIEPPAQKLLLEVKNQRELDRKVRLLHYKEFPYYAEIGLGDRAIQALQAVIQKIG